MADSVTQGATQPDVPSPVPGKWRRRIRKTVIALAGLIVAVFLLIALLPTILSSGWVRGLGVGQANDLIPGSVALDRMGLGWFAPLQLDNLRLSDVDGSAVVQLDSFSIERSLYGMATEKDRLGQVRLQGLRVSIRRDAAGRFNYEGLIPPADPNAPPPPPEPEAGPLVLRLSELIPLIPMPTSRLDVELAGMTFAFTDDSQSPPLTAELADAKVTMKWDGNGTPLFVTFAGEARHAGKVVPLVGQFTLKDWESGGTINLRGAQFDGFFDARPTDGQPQLVTWNGKLGGEQFNGDMRLEMAAVERLFDFSPTELPAVDGALVGTLKLDTSSDPVLVRAGMQLIDLGVQQGTSVTLTLPKFTLDAGAELTQVGAAPKAADLAMVLPGGELRLTAKMPSASEVTFEGAGSIETLPLYGLVSGAMVEQLPVLDLKGLISLKGAIRDGVPEDLEIEGAFQPRSLELKEVPDTGPAFVLIDKTIDLSPLAATFELRDSPDAGNHQIVGRWDSKLVTADLDGQFRGADDLSAAVTVVASLDELHQFITSEATLDPAVTMAGQLTLNQQVTMAGTTLTHKGAFNGERLFVAMALLPRGRWQDTLSASWEGTTILKPGYPTILGTRFDSSHIDGTLDLEMELERSAHLRTALALDLTALQEDFRPEGPELPARSLADAGGILLVDADVTSDLTTFATTWDAGLAGGENFFISSGDYFIQVGQLEARTAGSFAMKDGGFSVSGMRNSARLADTLSLRLDGQIDADTDAYTIALETGLGVDYAGLTNLAAGYLGSAMQAEFGAEGNTTATMALELAVRTGEAITFPKPVVVTLTEETSIPALIFSMPDHAVTIEGISDSRSLKATVDPADPVNATWSEEGTFASAVIDWNGKLALAGLSVTTGGGREAEGRHRYGITGGSFESIGWTADGMNFALPQTSYTFEASVTPELDAATVTATGKMAPLFEGGLKLDWETKDEAYELALETNSSGDISGLWDAEKGELLESFVTSVGGNWQTSLNAKIKGPGRYPGETSPLPTEWEANLTAAGSNLSLVHPAARIEGASFSVGLSTFEEDWSFFGEITPAIQELSGAPAPYLTDLFAMATGRYTSTGELSLDDSVLLLPEGGTRINLAGTIQNIPATIEAFSAATEEKPADPVALALGMPMKWVATINQDFLKVENYNAATSGTGVMDVVASFENLPGQHLNLDGSATFDNVSIRYGTLATLAELDGTAPWRKRLFYSPTITDRRRSELGTVGLGNVKVDFPPYSFEINDTAADVKVLNTSLAGTLSSAGFLGGTLQSTFRLRREEGDPVLAFDYSLTGLDGATLYPALRNRPLATRGLTSFGFMRMRMRNNSGVNGLIDDMVLHMDGTGIGRDLLREALRTVDPQGASPGIQSTVMALGYASPVDGNFDMRNGLMSTSVRLQTAVGNTFTMPIFDRTSASNVLESYVDPSYDVMLALGRLALVVLLTENLDELKSHLASGETPE